MNQTAHAPGTIQPYTHPSSRAAPAWPEARVAALKRAWREGQSASEIAARLGGGLSRCAVIGKLHRLGLCGGHKPSTPKTTTSGKGGSAPIAPISPIPWARRHPVTIPTKWLEAGPDPLPTSAAGGTPPKGPGPKYLRDMTPRECRFGLGDPGVGNGAFQLFCAAPTVGHAYCADHRKIACLPPSSMSEQIMNAVVAKL